MTLKKRIMALLFSVFLLVTTLFMVYAEDPPADGADTAPEEEEVVGEEDIEEEDTEVFEFETVASNSRFTLAYDPDTYFIRLTDKKTGMVWDSNPTIPTGADPYTEGIANTDIRSIMHIVYTNTSRAQKDANSYAQCVMKDGVKMRKLDNGVRFDYVFEEMAVTIPVQFILNDDGMTAEILLSEIKEDGANFVNNINFMQYFGTAGETDEGYMVVPDGSGAIIRFNNKKNKDAMAYSKPVFGKDLATITVNEIRSSRQEEITLPVYGMVKGGYGFLAEITNGAEMATVKANVSGNRLVGAYNTVYTNTVYRVFYSLPLLGQTETSDVLYNAQDPVACEKYSVQYHFTDQDTTDYIDLACLYRDILTERGWLTKDPITDALYVDFYGGVNKKKSFAGLLYNSRETLTSFEQAQAILQDLRQNGVDNINVNFVDFSDDYFVRDPQIGLVPSGSLGGEKSLSALAEYTAGENIPLSMQANFVTLPSSGNGLSTFWDVSDAINISPIEVYPFSLQNNAQDQSLKPVYLLKPDHYGAAVDTLLKSVTEQGYSSLYFDDDAMELYSDLAPEGFQRDRALTSLREQVKRIRDAGVQLTMSNPNVYLFEYASRMVNIPIYSSKNILFDQDIPFLQTVLRGMKNIAGENINITDVSQENFLRHLEYGTDIRYALMQADNEVLVDTDLTSLYSARYDTFREQIGERYKQLAEFGEAVGDAVITDHQTDGKTAVTTYDNGVRVIVNYGDSAATVDGVSVDAMSCVIQ